MCAVSHNSDANSFLLDLQEFSSYIAMLIFTRLTVETVANTLRDIGRFDLVDVHRDAQTTQ